MPDSSTTDFEQKASSTPETSLSATSVTPAAENRAELMREETWAPLDNPTGFGPVVQPPAYCQDLEPGWNAGPCLTPTATIPTQSHVGPIVPTIPTSSAAQHGSNANPALTALLLASMVKAVLNSR